MIDEYLRTKRAGSAHSAEAITSFVAGVVSGEVSRPQAAAWLAFAFTRGLDDQEAVALTRAMTDSGDRLDWTGLEGPFVDKHSTGGVGDKVSLILAPVWAALGKKVPMISGRGLGHTGGTLDKLEAIPGFRTDLDNAALYATLRDVGFFMNGQTARLAPADRILYALRNETQTVECIPLIVASILSKKLAEGLDELHLDVKVGSGAFMKDEASARALAEALVRVGNGAGVRTTALLTDMSQPLGEACGNGLEVIESLDCLRGEGPADLRELVVRFGGPGAAEVLDNGQAMERFERMVVAHHGDLAAFRNVATVERFEAPADGVVTQADAWHIGRAAFILGAGRLRAEDPVNPHVGVMVKKKVGDRVVRGEVLAELHHADVQLDAARQELVRAFRIGDSAERPALIRGMVPPA